MIHGQHHDEQAVLGQVLAVAQHHVAHVADAQAVDEHLAAGHRARHVHRRAGQLDDLAVLRDMHVLVVHAQRPGQVGVVVQVAILAVHRDKELRMHQRVDQLELLLAGVAGDVYLGERLVDDVRAGAVELVDHAGNGLFVARNGGGRDDDHVGVADDQLFMLGKGHARQAGHRFALGAGRDDHDLVVVVAVEVVRGNQPSLGNGQLAQLHGHLGHVDHAAADHAHLAVKAHRRVDHLLNAVDIAGEHGDDDAPVRLLEVFGEGLAHLALAHGVAGALDVGRVGQQGQYALIAQLGEAAQVDLVIVDGGIVDLEVAGMHHRAHRRMDGHRHRAGDRVGDVDKLHAECARLHHVARTDHVHLDVVDAMLLELVLDQRQRQPGAVHRGGNLRQDIGTGADVILMAVCDEIAAQARGVLFKVGCIGDDQVYARHVVARENRTQIDHDDVVLIFVDRHVLADFAQSAQRNDAKPGLLLF